MFGKLFIAFAIIPVMEIYLLVKVGSVIGTLNTVILVLISAFVGASLARSQGAATMQKVKLSLDQGRMPAEELLDAFMIFGAGLVLLTPGFITDAMGILLLIPFTRKYIKNWLRDNLQSWMKSPNVHVHYQQTEFRAWTNDNRHDDPDVIEIQSEDRDKQ
jgi:UPF0716 protein FxsA